MIKTERDRWTTMVRCQEWKEKSTTFINNPETSLKAQTIMDGNYLSFPIEVSAIVLGYSELTTDNGEKEENIVVRVPSPRRNVVYLLAPWQQ